MYRSQLPADPAALRALAEQRWQELDAAGELPALGVRELQLQKIELELQLGQLRRTNELLTAAINGAPDAIFMKDIDGSYLLINKAEAEMAGRPPEEILVKDDRNLFDAREAAAVIAQYRAVMSDGARLSIEQKLTMAVDSLDFWTVKIPFRDAQGRVHGIAGYARDITAFKRAEVELRESEKRFRTLADNLPDGLYLLDPNDESCPLKIVYANKAAAESDGYVVDQLLGRSITMMLDLPVSAAGAAERRRRVMNGEVIEFQVEHRHRLGHSVPYEVRAVAIPWQGRSLILGMNRNISARRQAEAALRDNEARLAEAQEIGGVGSFEIDIPSWQGHCSRALCRIFGFENDEPFRDFPAFIQKYCHPDDLERSSTSRVALVQNGTNDDIEHRYLHPNGEVRFIHVRRRVIRDELGVPVKLVGTVQDITERRQAEEKLRSSEARYRTFVDHVADAMFLHAADGAVLDVNQQACDSLGYTREELINQLPFAFDPVVQPAQLAEVHVSLDAGQSIEVETRHRRKDGTTFPVEVRVRPFWVDGQRFSISLAQNITLRKNSEQALRASEQRFRELADALPQIVFTAGPDGGLTHLNARAAEYTGLQIADLTGWSWEAVIHPDDIAATLRDWEQILISGSPRPLEFRIRRANGEYRWHIARQTAAVDASGNVTQWYGTCTDIEDLKRAEQALRTSEERYRKLFDSIPDPMFVYDPVTLRFQAVNDAAVEKYGYSRAEFGQLTLRDIRTPQPAADNPDLWRHRQKNGDWIDVEVTAHELELDGHPALIAVARDVTDRRKAEAQLRTTSELLRVVAEGTPDAVFVKDRAGRYLLFNPAAARFVGKPAAEVLGKDDTALFAPEDAAIVRSIDRQVMETEQASINEETLTAAGVTRTYLAMKAPYRDGNGQIVGTIGISRDITERKQAEKELALRQAELRHVSRLNTVGEMVAAISHDVAQPLVAISNYAASSSALLKSLTSSTLSGKALENLEQARRHIDQIVQQSRRAGDIISRLREYCRKSPPQRTLCDLNELLRNSVEMLSAELRGGEVSLVWDLAADLPRVPGDPVQLQQVVVNLLLNARDSLLESSAISRKIALRSRVDLGAVVVEVEDNGVGLSEEIALRMYEPFVTTKPHGMGMGLNICRSILRDHQGEIHYHQVNTGGVLFRIHLPLTETSASRNTVAT